MRTLGNHNHTNQEQQYMKQRFALGMTDTNPWNLARHTMRTPNRGSRYGAASKTTPNRHFGANYPQSNPTNIKHLGQLYSPVRVTNLYNRKTSQNPYNRTTETISGNSNLRRRDRPHRKTIDSAGLYEIKRNLFGKPLVANDNNYTREDRNSRAKNGSFGLRGGNGEVINLVRNRAISAGIGRKDTNNLYARQRRDFDIQKNSNRRTNRNLDHRNDLHSEEESYYTESSNCSRSRYSSEYSRELDEEALTEDLTSEGEEEYSDEYSSDYGEEKEASYDRALSIFSRKVSGQAQVLNKALQFKKLGTTPIKGNKMNQDIYNGKANLYNRFRESNKKPDHGKQRSYYDPNRDRPGTGSNQRKDIFDRFKQNELMKTPMSRRNIGIETRIPKTDNRYSTRKEFRDKDLDDLRLTYQGTNFTPNHAPKRLRTPDLANPSISKTYSHFGANTRPYSRDYQMHRNGGYSPNHKDTTKKAIGGANVSSFDLDKPTTSKKQQQSKRDNQQTNQMETYHNDKPSYDYRYDHPNRRFNKNRGSLTPESKYKQRTSSSIENNMMSRTPQSKRNVLKNHPPLTPSKRPIMVSDHYTKQDRHTDPTHNQMEVNRRQGENSPEPYNHAKPSNKMNPAVGPSYPTYHPRHHHKNSKSLQLQPGFRTQTDEYSSKYNQKEHRNYQNDFLPDRVNDKNMTPFRAKLPRNCYQNSSDRNGNHINNLYTANYSESELTSSHSETGESSASYLTDSSLEHSTPPRKMQITQPGAPGCYPGEMNMMQVDCNNHMRRVNGTAEKRYNDQRGNRNLYDDLPTKREQRSSENRNTSFFKRLHERNYIRAFEDGFADYLSTSRQELLKARKLQKAAETNFKLGDSVYLPSSYSRRKTLLLDMDETLIHSEEYKQGTVYDLIIDMAGMMRNTQKIGVFIRPYCREFLERLKDKYELVIFTAARKDYADKVISKLDPYKSLFTARLYRNNCTQIQGSYVKDFRVIKNRPLTDMMLVDNLIYSYAANMKHGLPIRPYLRGDDDYELEFLAERLETMKPFDDVAEFLEREFRLSEFYNFL